MTSTGLSCKELIEILTEYLEDTLPSSERARVDDHLAICDGCRTYLEQMEQTIRWLGKLSEEQIPEEAKRKLLQAFRDWNTSKQSDV